jgi:hypothetical protein
MIIKQRNRKTHEYGRIAGTKQRIANTEKI